MVWLKNKSTNTLIEENRCSLQDSGIDKKYYGEAANTANYFKNRLPTKAIEEPQRSLELQKGKFSTFKSFWM